MPSAVLLFKKTPACSTTIRLGTRLTMQCLGRSEWRQRPFARAAAQLGSAPGPIPWAAPSGAKQHPQPRRLDRRTRSAGGLLFGGLGRASARRRRQRCASRLQPGRPAQPSDSGVGAGRSTARLPAAAPRDRPNRRPPCPQAQPGARGRATRLGAALAALPAQGALSEE